MSLIPNHQTDNSIQVRFFHSEEEFFALRDAWGSLFTQSNANSAFLSWEWLFCWWRAYGKKNQLRLVTAWRDEALVGIAPMMLVGTMRYGLKMRLLRSLGAPDIDIGGFVVLDDDPMILVALCRALVEKVEDWDILEFNQFKSESATTAFIRDYFIEAGFVLRSKTEWHYYLPTLGKWDDYYQQLSKNLRTDLRKKMRRVEKMGSLSFERYIGRNVTQDHLSSLFQLNEHSRYPDIYHTTEEKEFQRSLLDCTSPYNWPDLSFLSIDNKPVAYIYGFLTNKRYEAWRTGFDLSYFEISVGKLMLLQLLEDCFRHEYREIDFLRGDEGYKESWQPHYRTFYTKIRVISPRNLAAKFAFVWIPDLKARMKPLVVRLPGLFFNNTETDKVRKPN